MRAKAQQLYRIYRALLVLSAQNTPKLIAETDAASANVAAAPARLVRAVHADLKTLIAKIDRTIGLRLPYEEYPRIVDGLSPSPLVVTFIRKELFLQWFEHYERLWTPFRRLPRHGRLAVYPRGAPAGGNREWWLLEAKLFEDVAALWNQVNSLRQQSKWREALQRATARAAFHLLEGYLSGLAFELEKGPGRTQRELDRLHDWDSEKNKPRFLSLRDKLLQYQRIALRRADAPLQPSNCREMRDLLEWEDRVRNRLVHPSTMTDRDRNQSREIVFFTLSTEEVGRIVDATTGLIEKLSTTVGPEWGDVTMWLHHRDADGQFPDVAFL